MSDILVVDDDALTRDLVGEWLTNAGYNVRKAENGEAAVAMPRAAPARLLITDMQMPRLSGAETLAIVRRELPSMRIIAMSARFGSGLGVLKETALALGVAHVLGKPFGHSELLSLVNEIL